MRLLVSLYSPKLPIYLVYMLQQVEYEPAKLIEWLRKIDSSSPSLAHIMRRQKLVYTQRAKSLVAAGYICFLLPIAFGVVILFWLDAVLIMWLLILLAALIITPVAVLVGLVCLVSLAHNLIAAPRERQLIIKSEEIFKGHKGIKIAVAGSYGKTTMKELLTTVLSEKFNVAATPGNMNTSVAHARFVAGLSGDEDILIIEYGEGKPGDVEQFAKATHPDYAIITGLAPNHLDHYGSIDVLADDIFSLRRFVSKDKLLIADNSELIHQYLGHEDNTFSDKSVLGWKISDVDVGISGVSFMMTKAKRGQRLHSDLLGRHQVAPLALVVALGIDLGMSEKQVTASIAKTVAFEHRMQPYMLGGAWIIDDSYNGNLEGFRAGLALLKELKAKRKIYVTPGLVDQGTETERVHREIAELVIGAKPDKVVLMDNSATKIINERLLAKKFVGEIIIELDPLSFYQNLEQFVATGDLVLMQNDWTDNYN